MLLRSIAYAARSLSFSFFLFVLFRSAVRTYTACSSKLASLSISIYAAKRAWRDSVEWQKEEEKDRRRRRLQILLNPKSENNLQLVSFLYFYLVHLLQQWNHEIWKLGKKIPISWKDLLFFFYCNKRDLESVTSWQTKEGPFDLCVCFSFFFVVYVAVWEWDLRHRKRTKKEKGSERTRLLLFFRQRKRKEEKEKKQQLVHPSKKGRTGKKGINWKMQQRDCLEKSNVGRKSFSFIEAGCHRRWNGNTSFAEKPFGAKIKNNAVKKFCRTVHPLGEHNSFNSTYTWKQPLNHTL